MDHVHNIVKLSRRSSVKKTLRLAYKAQTQTRLIFRKEIRNQRLQRTNTGSLNNLKSINSQYLPLFPYMAWKPTSIS